MYETTFGFNARPFAAAPQSDCYYDSGPVESARKTIIECIERAEGPALLVGPPGVGKSLVCQKIAEYFDSQFRVVLLTDARIGSRKELLQNILFDLGLSYQDIDEGELRLSLIDFLDPQDSPTSGMLLIIDEADTLSVELLEEIRMITNLVRDGQPRVRLLLSGGPELETLFANPKLETFNQRIARRCYLHNLNEQQTAEYVRSQISGVGGNANQVFTDEAIASIFTASDGSPRFINQLCDHALLLNSVSGFDSVNEDSISEAWSDLQQLPAPWDSEPEEPAPSFIEFGELSDDSQSSSGAESNAEATPPVGDQALDQLDAIQQEVDRIVENETPQSEEPQSEEPQSEEPQSEVPATEEPQAEELQTEVTSTEEPATEELAEQPAAVEATETTEAPAPAEEIQNVDPFGDDFAEEETVFDPHTSASAQAPLPEIAPAPAPEANEEVEADLPAESFEAEAPAMDASQPADGQWDEPTDIELEGDPSDSVSHEEAAESEFALESSATDLAASPEAEEEDTEPSEPAAEIASDDTEANHSEVDAETSDADHESTAAEPIALIGSSLSMEEPATIEQASDETEDFAIAAAESETPASDLSDNVSAQTEVHGQEEVAADEPAAFDEATSESEEEAEAAVNEEVAPLVEEADATPTHTSEHDTDEVPMMGSTSENAESTMFDVAASDDEPTSDEEIAPAAESSPMRTMQLDSDVISQSIEASREEIFSIDTDAEPPSPSGESESEKDDFFLIDSDDESESEPKAESPSEDVFAIESDEPSTTPGEWPLAGPIDEQIEPISDEEAAEESIAFATEAAYRTPAADAAETVEESTLAEEDSATPQVLDDRDMIVVEEPQEDVVAEEDLPRARRQEYRQLFARLRKSQ